MRVLVVVLLALLAAGPAAAMDVGWSRVELADLEQGALDVAEDAQGFLWFATERGLVRFDGERTRAVHPSGQRIAAIRVVAARGEIWATTRAGALYVVRGDGLEAVLADGEHVIARALAGTSRDLWVWGPTGLRVLDDAGWSEVAPAREGQWVLHLRPHGDGVYVASTAGLWFVDREGERLVRAGLAVDVAPLGDGRLAVQARDLVLMDGATERVLLPHQHKRAMSLVERKGVLYLTYSHQMFRVTLDGFVSPLRRAHLGGPPLTDRTFVASDGTLWLGAVRLIEPETRIWSGEDGMPSGSRWLTAAPDGSVYVAAWTGTSRVTALGPTPGFAFAGDRTEHVCVDDGGRALAFVERRGLVDLAGGEVLVPEVWGSGCGASGDGGVWMLGRGRLWLAGQGTVTEVAGPPEVFRAIVETSRGELIAVGGTSVCEAEASAVRAGEEEPWRCEELPPVVGPNLVCALEASPGVVWVCSEGDGIWERAEDGGWGPADVNEALPVRSVSSARSSRRGGVWVQQGKRVVRMEREGGRWVTAERVDERVGLPMAVADVDEDADGNLWLATRYGVAFVPRDRRLGDVGEAPPRLIGATVDGKAASEPLVVPSGGTAELQFAALAYRHPEGLRYRWRLGEGAWSSPSRSGTIRLAGLANGAVGLSVASSLDGERWSSPVGVDLRVLPPWYLRPWFWLVVLGVGLLGAWAVRRVRARMARAAEAQRARIAMDLHDELGAGLGSISILAGLLTSDRVPPEKAREAARTIAASAEELGGSVTDIVWSLRSGGHDLPGLVVYLRERAAMVLDRERTAFRVEGEVPAVALAPELARALQLVLVEALYNAARHGQAEEVVLGVGVADGVCTVVLRDDGVGLAGGPATRAGGGSGLRNMERRADEVGAALTFEVPPGGGTQVRVVFPVNGARG